MRLVVRAVRASFRPGGCRGYRGDYHAHIEIEGQTLLDESRSFPDGDHILDEVIEIPDEGGALTVVARVRDGDAWQDESRRIHRPPYPRRLTLQRGSWVVELRLSAPTTVRRPPRRARVARSSPGHETTTRVLAPPAALRVEVDPVIPIPDRPQLRRPQWTHASEPDFERGDLTRSRANQPRVNPSVIARTTDRGWVATVSHTRTWAPGWDEADLGSRITWRARSLSGGASVRFLGAPRGLFVRVLGEGGDGDVAIDAFLHERRVATHVALVRRPVTLPVRFTFYRPPNDPRPLVPSVLPSDFPAQGGQPRIDDPYRPGAAGRALTSANSLLSSIAVRLVVDSDHEPTADAAIDGVRAVDGEPGVFWRHARSFSELQPPRNQLGALILQNARQHVLHAVGVVALPENDIGVTPLPCLHDSETLEDGLERSSSWVAPSGVPPDDAAREVSMNRIHRHPYPEMLENVAPGDATHHHGVAVAAPGWWGGGTLAHEIGHAFGLRHRHPSVDGLADLGETNLMASGSSGGDLDRLQARVVWQSSILRHHHRLAWGSDPP